MLHIPDEFKSCREITCISKVQDIPSWNTPCIMELKEQFHRFPYSTLAIKEFLRNNFGNCQVSISKGKETQDILLSDWISQKETGWYLKDWHINTACSESGIGDVFTTPLKLTDWLNEFHRSSNTHALDFQFLYWGNAGTITAYHQDVLGTFSWSHNLCGKKLWKFYYRDDDGPLILRLIQGPGETVFVPSGCFHTVENLVDDTISINQNWFNEHNLMHVAKRLVLDSIRVVNELKEFAVVFDSREELAERVGLIVKSNNSLNIDLLSTIFEWRMTTCQVSLDAKLAIHLVVEYIQLDVSFLTQSCIQQLSRVVKY